MPAWMLKITNREKSFIEKCYKKDIIKKHEKERIEELYAKCDDLDNQVRHAKSLCWLVLLREKA